MISWIKKICPVSNGQCKSLLHSSSFIGGAEVVNRVTRILTIIALSWTLGVAEFGLAAAALTIYELIRVLTQNGLGTQIVVANDDEVERLSSIVYRLNWYIAIVLAIFQLSIAWPVALYFESAVLGWGVAALALVFLIYPFSMVHVYRAQRDHKWKQVSAAIAGQAAIDNILTAILAFAGFGIWAVVLPKLVVAPLWVVFHRRYTDWHYQPVLVSFAELKKIFSYGIHILGAEILNVLRAHGDKLLVGIILGPKALGFYAFASNIGNGITISLSTTLGNAVILPHLRKGRDQGNMLESYHQTLMLMTVIMLPIVLSQAVFAHWYVPVIFGEKWVPVIPVLIILAMSALARPMQVATSQALRANHETSVDFQINLYMTLLFFVGMVTGLQWGILGAAIGIWISQFLSSFIILYLGNKTVGKKQKSQKISASQKSKIVPATSGYTKVT